jgi:hypothetical protein
VLGSEPCRKDADVALEATRRKLAEVRSHELLDLTLCHGAAGAAEVLLCGTGALGRRWSEPAELGRLALERHDATDGDWPCGAAGGSPPGLFRGLSGIGWWLLRLQDGAIASPLTMPIGNLTAIVARA